MDDATGKPANPFVVGLLLLLLTVGAYLAGRWSAQDKLRQAQAETDRYRMLAESEQALRQRAEQDREEIRVYEPPPSPLWDVEKARRIEELLKRKWEEHIREFSDERE